jgi:hypothetical protein
MKIQPYQFKEASVTTGLVLDNHFRIMFGNKPQMLKKGVTRLLSSAGVRNLDTLLDQFPTTKLEEEDIYTWEIAGESERNLPLVYAVEYGKTTPIAPGTGNTSPNTDLILYYEEDDFREMHMIVGRKNEIYQLRIKETYTEGDLHACVCELMGRNKSTGMPVSELQPGIRFSKDFSPVEDVMSTKGGEISFASNSKVGNEFTTIRIEHKEPGKNIGKKVVSPIIIRKGGTEVVTNTWMPAVEWELQKTWSYEKAHAIAFARSNATDDGRYFNIGKSGYYIKQGMGLREQQEASGILFYDRFSLRTFEAILSDIGAGKLAPSQRTIMVRTGEMGLAQASRAIADDQSGWQALGGMNPMTYRKTTSEWHPNAFVAGFQFTEWIAPMGYHVKFEVDPMYDSKIRNTIMAPHLGPGVAESFRYDIYFIGDTSEPNIYKVELTRGDDWGYESGFRNPITGERQIMNMSHAEDSATYTRYGSFSAAIVDPGKVVTYLPNVLQ